MDTGIITYADLEAFIYHSLINWGSLDRIARQLITYRFNAAIGCDKGRLMNGSFDFMFGIRTNTGIIDLWVYPVD